MGGLLALHAPARDAYAAGAISRRWGEAGLIARSHGAGAAGADADE